MKLSMKFAVLALCFGASSAHASLPAQSQAGLSNIGFELIDLDLDDGRCAEHLLFRTSSIVQIRCLLMRMTLALTVLPASSPITLRQPVRKCLCLAQQQARILRVML